MTNRAYSPRINETCKRRTKRRQALTSASMWPYVASLDPLIGSKGQGHMSEPILEICRPEALSKGHHYDQVYVRTKQKLKVSVQKAFGSRSGSKVWTAWTVWTFGILHSLYWLYCTHCHVLQMWCSSELYNSKLLIFLPALATESSANASCPHRPQPKERLQCWAMYWMTKSWFQNMLLAWKTCFAIASSLPPHPKQTPRPSSFNVVSRIHWDMWIYPHLNTIFSKDLITDSVGT